ncbi:MAG TPA: PrsW family glutamic-type intramembrane protease [Bacteroidia bacterium]|jgi:RsiW-degrading membrane proteinase PrsW (M82 family)|nr:PrsW family glutamic-type intramembrane protease [Bacteroidia bacterium]
MDRIFAASTKRPFLYCCIALAISALLINVLTHDKPFNTKANEAYFYSQTGRPAKAEELYLSLIRDHSTDLDLQRNYVLNHYTLPAIVSQNTFGNVYRNDASMISFFNELKGSVEHAKADIGYYCSGLIRAEQGNYREAVAEFSHVQNTNMKYLNNTYGNALFQLDSAAKAEKLFRKEIELGGYLTGAYENLAYALVKEKKFNSFDSLIKTPAAKQYITPRAMRSGFYAAHQPLLYIATLFTGFFSKITWWGAIAAFLIMAGWIMYLRRLDFSGNEKWTRITLVTGMGILAALLGLSLYDFMHTTLHFNLNGHFINDSLYCVFAIGAIEELVKFIPVLLLLWFTKAIREPYDYIKFASLSAIGFAFAENMEYFHTGNEHIIHGRALSASVYHMFNSSIIAYGLLLNRYRWKKNPVVIFLLFYLLAAFTHGFYDFWLVSRSTAGYAFLTMILLFASIHFWNVMLNNALSNSDLDREKLKPTQESLKAFLLFTLTGVLIFEFVSEGLLYGPTAANYALYTSVKGGTYLLVFISIRLSAFHIKKGEWHPLTKFISTSRSSYVPIDGSYAVITDLPAATTPITFLPNTGTIERSILLFNQPGWILVKLENEFADEQFNGSYIVIRPGDTSALFQVGGEYTVSIFAIPNTALIDQLSGYEKFVFVGWAIIHLSAQPDHSAVSR